MSLDKKAKGIAPSCLQVLFFFAFFWAGENGRSLQGRSPTRTGARVGNFGGKGWSWRSPGVIGRVAHRGLGRGAWPDPEGEDRGRDPAGPIRPFDPHEEHDFGAFDADGKRVFFKIDYYDKDLSMHSPDAADPAVTQRVITIMLAEEY